MDKFQFNRNLPWAIFVAQPQGAMHWTRAIPLSLLALVSCTHALHFYLEAEQKRCFVEELPTDTVVDGQCVSLDSSQQMKYHVAMLGHYKALEWDEKLNTYKYNEELGIEVEVEVNTLH